MIKGFRNNQTYSHLTAKDLDIYVIRVSYANLSKSKLKIMYISKTTGKPAYFPGGSMDGIHNITIKSSDYKYWSLIPEKLN